MGEDTRGLQERLEEIKRLNRSRFDFVLARSDTDSNQEAYTAIKKSESWFYKFSELEREELIKLADELHYSKAIKAQLILQEAADEAARVKVNGLRSRDQKIQQASASEILDRTVGKPGDNLTVKGHLTFSFNPHRPQQTGES